MFLPFWSILHLWLFLRLIICISWPKFSTESGKSYIILPKTRKKVDFLQLKKKRITTTNLYFVYNQGFLSEINNLGSDWFILTEYTNDTLNWPPTLEETAIRFPKLHLGGYYPGPDDCQPRQSTAFIIPMRDREEHLK